MPACASTASLETPLLSTDVMGLVTSAACTEGTSQLADCDGCITPSLPLDLQEISRKWQFPAQAAVALEMGIMCTGKTWSLQ